MKPKRCFLLKFPTILSVCLLIAVSLLVANTAADGIGGGTGYFQITVLVNLTFPTPITASV
jgi:hypothetical protein